MTYSSICFLIPFFQDIKSKLLFLQIRGRDLPGAVNVLPLGLSEVLAKRESKEIYNEVGRYCSKMRKLKVIFFKQFF